MICVYQDEERGTNIFLMSWFHYYFHWSLHNVPFILWSVSLEQIQVWVASLGCVCLLEWVGTL